MWHFFHPSTLAPKNSSRCCRCTSSLRKSCKIRSDRGVITVRILMVQDWSICIEREVAIVFVTLRIHMKWALKSFLMILRIKHRQVYTCLLNKKKSECSHERLLRVPLPTKKNVYFSRKDHGKSGFNRNRPLQLAIWPAGLFRLVAEPRPASAENDFSAAAGVKQNVRKMTERDMRSWT